MRLMIIFLTAGVIFIQEYVKYTEEHHLERWYWISYGSKRLKAETKLKNALRPGQTSCVWTYFRKTGA